MSRLATALQAFVVLGPATLFAQSTPSVADLTWLVGHWTGALGKARIEEHWLPPTAGAMLGIGRTIAGDRMVSFEFLRIEQRADGLYYVAQPGGRPPTNFKLTNASAHSVRFENPGHDHPKIITYRLDASGILIATVEGDEGGKHKKQDFRMTKRAAP